MSEHIAITSPTSRNAGSMCKIARDSGVLSVNSPYFYALMPRHFNATCLVAKAGKQICGYVIGFRVPDRPDTVFVWQVGVAENTRGKGVGRKLLAALIDKNRPLFLEATIARENLASIHLFMSVARHLGADHSYSEQPFFTVDDLGSEDEPEHLMRIGPIQADAGTAAPKN